MEIKLTEEDIEKIALSVVSKLDAPKNNVKVYSAPDIANILGCHKNTVYKYIDNGLLKASHNGKGYLISHESLKAFLDGKKD